MLPLLWLLTVFALENLDIPQADLICHPDVECYPRIFVATDTFQILHDDQKIPEGLHIRINLQTGLKEAKLADPTEAIDDDQAAVLLSSEEQRDFEHKPNPRISHDDHSDFSKNIDILTSISLHDVQALPTLQALEELAHEIDFGLKIAQGPGMESLLNFLASGDPEIRAMAATVIGSALQNNTPALQISAQFNVVYHLVRRLSVEKNDSVKLRMIYALNASFKSQHGSQMYAHTDGGVVLRAAVESAQSQDVIGKVATFVEDNIAPMEMSSWFVQSPHVYQTTSWHINEKRAWCNLFQRALQSEISDVDIRGKVLDSLRFDFFTHIIDSSAIKRANPDLCITDQEFLEFLANNTVGRETSFVSKIKKIRHLFGNRKKEQMEEWKQDV